MKKLLQFFRPPLILSLFLANSLFSQAPLIEWQNTIGGNNYDFLQSIQPASDNGFILGGTSNSNISGDKSEMSRGGDDYWFVKLSSSGAVEWNHTYGGTNDDELTSVKETPDGGYILAGYSSSNTIGGNKTEAGMGGVDYWVVKLNADGDIDFQNTIGGSSDDFLYDVDCTADGGYILAGTSRSGISGDKTENKMGDASDFGDMWIIKLNSIGDIVWQNTIGSFTTDGCKKIIALPDGGYLVGGEAAGGISGDKSEASISGTTDYWILKLNATGAIVWQNVIGSNYGDEFTDMIATADGGYLVGGYTIGTISGDKTENAIGYYDYWVVKLNVTGVVEWDKTIGGTDEDFLYALAQTPDGGYTLCGASTSDISGNKSENTVGSGDFKDYWVVQLNSTGTLQWENTIGGNKDDFLRSVCIASDGGIVLAGDSQSNASGDKSEISVGGGPGIYGPSDYWVVKLTAPVCPVPTGLYSDNITPSKATVHWNALPGIDTYQLWYRATGTVTWIKKTALVNFKTLKSLTPETAYEYKVRSKCDDGSYGDFSTFENFTTLPLKTGEISDELNIHLFPNPASNTINISATVDAESVIIIINNSVGQQFYSGACASSNSDLNTSIEIADLPAGIYFLQIITNNQIFTDQFIKQ